MRYDQAFRQTGYHTALLTTFSFDPTVFENVLLVAMRSRGCRNIGVLADRKMVNRTLHEIAAAPRAGATYHLAKRSVTGAFHPKIVLQLGEKVGRLMVGSANLTGAGLVGNLETVSTIVVSEEDKSAAPLLAEALHYFEVHSDKSDRSMREVLGRARDRTPWLVGIEPRAEVAIEDKRLAFLTETESAGTGERFRDFVGDDSISRLVVVSPYADKTLDGFTQLREAFGSPTTAFVVDPDAQDFTAETFSAQADASLHSSEPLQWGGRRPLHAKMIIACGNRADYVFAGSANASIPGLFSRYGGSGNAEAGIALTEPAGTTIDCLQLSDCLSTQLPFLAMNIRTSLRSASEVESAEPLDGGDCWIEHGSVFWREPAGYDHRSCKLRLVDSSGAVIVEGSPIAEGDRLSCRSALTQKRPALLS